MEKKKKELDIHRPVVWVTGASRGIGKEIAKQFAFIGCEVVLSARSKNQLINAVKEITSLGGRAYSFPCDFAEHEQVIKTTRLIARKIGEVDVLVNNAGITVFKSFLNTSLKEFDDLIDTNLEGPIACIKSVLPSMVKKKKGWIFNIVSNAAIKPFEGASAYTATKAGLLGLGRVLREELRHYGIKVVNVLPSATDTDIWHSKVRAKYRSKMMTAKSVAETVLSIYQLPDDVVVDEIVIRPMKGDLS